MFLWNARSIVNKTDYVKSLFTSKSVDVFCITETWLHDQVLDNEFIPHGYSIYRRDRINKRGGGVLIAVSNKLRSKLVISHPDAEIITIELCGSPKNYFYPVFMYR